MARRSDRWITPGVVVVLLLCGTLVVLGGLACLTYLTARGIDPDPMVKLAGALIAAVSSTVSVVLSLVTRRTTTKVERNTGHLVNAVLDVADAMPRPTTPPRHLYPDTEAMPPVNGATPVPRGS